MTDETTVKRNALAKATEGWNIFDAFDIGWRSGVGWAREGDARTMVRRADLTTAVEVAYGLAERLGAANALIVSYWCEDAPVGSGVISEIVAGVASLPDREREALLRALEDEELSEQVESFMAANTDAPHVVVERPGGHVKGIGWVARICDVPAGAIVRTKGGEWVMDDRHQLSDYPVVVTRWPVAAPDTEGRERA